MKYKLICPTCKEVTLHPVKTWQTCTDPECSGRTLVLKRVYEKEWLGK